MPRGPKGEKRPADVIGNAVHVMRIATGEIEEAAEVDDGKDPAAKALGRKGGRARAEAMAPERRAEVAEWLKSHAPEPKSGRNYHQWLSGQYGLKKLMEHIWMLIGLATACHDMRELRDRMAQKFGREGIQFTLYLPPKNSPGD